MGILEDEDRLVGGDVGRLREHLFMELAALERGYGNAVDADMRLVGAGDEAEGVAVGPLRERQRDEGSAPACGRGLVFDQVVTATESHGDIGAYVTAEHGHRFIGDNARTGKIDGSNLA